MTMTLEDSSEKASPRSLADVHSSVPIPSSRWRRLLAFAGPAFLVSVGYMDPGNWGTDIEAGSTFGYRLIWVLLLSNLMAVLLQGLATRLGIVTGRDLAQACREQYPRAAVWGLWLLCELAVAATDLAEVIGTVIALKMLFGLSYGWGVIVCACDTFLLLALQRRGVRVLEGLTLLLITVIAGSFFVEIVMVRPDWTAALGGLVPSFAPGQLQESLYVAIAMLGATVMPHKLYLQSALVQTRAFPQTSAGKKEACRFNLIDSAVALNGAFFINAAILVMAAATFAEPVQSLPQARELLQRTWHGLAGILFAVALLASGQSSTMTGTLAGQVVMEGFVQLRLRPWVRRLLTRSVAIIPALVLISLTDQRSSGESAAQTDSHVDHALLHMLVLSQAILSFQLPFAIVPLLQFTSDRERMGEFTSRGWLKVLSWSCAALVVVLNGVLIAMSIDSWADSLRVAGHNPWWVYGTVGSVAVLLAAFLGWLTVYPYWVRRAEVPLAAPAPVLSPIHYERIGVAIEFTSADETVLAPAAALAHSHRAELILVHVVEGAGASFLGPASDDQESRNDRTRMENLVSYLRTQDLSVRGVLGFGLPPQELVRIARENQFELLVMGAHGHRFLADMALGETVAPVLHRLTIPILVVPTRRTAASAPAC
jgi:manganese transport protein